ncbi:hypothetical protein AAMO2058_000546400 [Amorphochlora amoebiformis]
MLEDNFPALLTFPLASTSILGGVWLCNETRFLARSSAVASFLTANKPAYISFDPLKSKIKMKLLLLSLLALTTCGQASCSSQAKLHARETRSLSGLTRARPSIAHPHPLVLARGRNALKGGRASRQRATLTLPNSDPGPTKKKLSKRIVTGWLLAFAGTAVIFSGDVLYTLVLVTVAMMAQYEYFNTVMMTPVKPARRISFVASLAMYICACKFPHQHQLGLPIGFTAIIMWFLVMRPKPGSIADISTTLMGLVYTGLMPSYWAVLRCMKDVPGVDTAVSTGLAAWVQKVSPVSVAADVVSQGAITYWFTALGCALSDVGAYFGGKKWGRNKISSVCPAAGGASPNKTVEGFLSGAAMAMVTAIIGAKVMGWPHWVFTGIMYGTLVSVISLLGDLMASMIKRDAGVKDFGNIFPGHGGILDRLDSYIFVGPAAYAFVTLFLPFIDRIGVGPGMAGVASVVSGIAIMCTISRREFWTQITSGLNGLGNQIEPNLDPKPEEMNREDNKRET